MYSSGEIRSAANRAIKNILYEGTTDVELFTRPFELDFLKNDITKKDIVDNIEKSIMSGELAESKIKPIGKVLVPKKNLADFRICALIDIYDEIYYLTLVLLMGKAIEEDRIIASKKKVFSYRFIKDKHSEKLFFPEYNYTSFREEVRRKEQARGKHIVVECDISNFYDRLNLHRLESTLLSIENIDKENIELLNSLLLYWSNRDSYGLPIGSNASRILAEALLNNVDKFLVDKKISFCRFVDDYRLFAKDATEAHKYLTLLTERLQIEGLFMNSNKTKLKEVKKITNTDSMKIETQKLEISNSTENDSNNLQRDIEISKIIRGYSGIIPLKFRRMSNTECEKLKLYNINESLKKLKKDLLIDPYEFREYLKAAVSQETWTVFGESANLLEKFPQFIPYYVDIVVKYESEMDEKTIETLKNIFFNYLIRADSPEYIQIYIIRFFSLERMFDKEKILNFFYNLNRDSGEYIGRATLEVLSGKLGRRDLLELRRYFVRADIWEKRAILFLLNKGLPQEEKSAYFKNISITNTDILIKHMTNKKTKFLSGG